MTMPTKGLISLWDENLVSGDTLQRVQALQDLIRIRSGKLGLSNTLKSLRPIAWDIRLRATGDFLGEGSVSDLLPLQEKVREDDQLHKDAFSQASQYALEIYRKTLLGILDQSAGGLENVQLPPDFEFPYQVISQLEHVPQWSVKYLSRWITVSVDLDLLLIILDMHREEPLITESETFTRSLRTTAEYFGAYAAVLGFWKIGYEDSQAMTNTRIVSGMLQAQTDKISRPYTIAELKDRYNSLAG